jgi:adenylate cyclase
MNLVFQQQLGTELLRSEKRRTIILICMFLSALAFRFVYLFFFSGGEDASMINSFPAVWLFPMAIIGFELFTLFYIHTRLRSNRKQIPLALQFLNTGIEICLPSIVLLLVAKQYPELNVLQSPAVFIYFIFIILSTLRLNFLLSAFCGLLASGSYITLSIFLYHEFSLNDATRAFILLFSGIASGLVARQIRAGINHSLSESDKRSRMLSIFGRHISREIAEKVMENDGKIESKRMNVAIMFIDIRNFSRFVSGKNPEEIVHYQNKFFSIVIEAVAKYDGVVNQFLGDGCMVTFGAPVSLQNPSQSAVHASLELLRQLHIATENGMLEPTRIGIGIHAGEAITGNIGTATRQQYSVTGNVVIMASRIEQLNKEFDSQILVSEEVVRKIGTNLVNAESLGEIPLRGLGSAAVIYKVA